MKTTAMILFSFFFTLGAFSQENEAAESSDSAPTSLDEAEKNCIDQKKDSKPWYYQSSRDHHRGAEIDCKDELFEKGESRFKEAYSKTKDKFNSEEFTHKGNKQNSDRKSESHNFTVQRPIVWSTEVDY